MTTHPDYWNQLYRDEGRPGWDMDGATPLVRELLDLALPLGLRAGCDLVVPGCGYGHDAAALESKGFSVTGLDFAPLAIQGARSRYGDRVAWSQADWFTTQLGPWDAIFDHTCFPAMDPDRRPAYVEACTRHLRPGGLWMAALFHDVNGRPGPPHAIPMADLRQLVEPRFEILHLAEATASHPRRAGREYLMVARKRA
ncbi:MAG: methyltransferase domain-containing protein [Geothrix sp.]|uniref:methyltransferase domain-containing protein n=1 Tax=Geothrix sp. TaxID=1962974 RepID=UPI00178D2AB6|nr:methyltransferase domain-containing protein [Geothrix sp.]NWJ41933.1 methyltransferase domain-containing protein [Geothrix sp.]WIL20094.1 MAG: TPMT family class I SAM-dependent methyltransferase [Geothrix sp.]